MGTIRHDRRIDYDRLGGTLVLGAAVILAIRTARREPVYDEKHSNRDWEAEINFALTLTSALLMQAITDHAELFKQTIVKFTDGVVEDDVPK